MSLDKFTHMFLGAALGCAVACGSAFAITANPNVSIGKPLYVAGDVANYLNPLAYTDGKLDSNQITIVNDFALNVGVGPKKLFVTWDTRGDEAWASQDYVYAQGCLHNVSIGSTLQNFKIMTSANSTNGVDGDWQIAAEIGESGAASRGIAIDFEGMSWFRILASTPAIYLEEVSAYDISDGGDDTWFFMGTSITQMGMKQFAVDSNFSQLIHARYPDYYPAMIRGGIACVASQGVADALKYYAEYAGNVKYWAIEMGTNDAWVGNDYTVEQFTRNMQMIIDTAKAHGITPIIARMIATNPAYSGWQVPQEFLDAIDKLVKDNNLMPGPDFYNFFLAHPELISEDGVHPANPLGGQAMHRLWAEAVAPLYKNKKAEPVIGSKAPGTTAITAPKMHKMHVAMPQVKVDGRSISIARVNEPVTVTIVDLTGHIVWNGRVGQSTEGSLESSHLLSAIPAGNYIVKVRGATTSYKVRISIR
ncbi:SGNH/GDSL hydrolase family protein [Fibrobacter sp. UWB11]|uniref:T9SS type A sorting domain-containing protein n=1 Tax=Fibrobacter sp. UWB11 TaxID=1896202 RepID=UPI0009412F60|nr:SGNH/GDSL hydrolase family protein [Fibrobacter sp. UWB11]